MKHGHKSWIVCNPNSGSNDEQVLAELEQALAETGFNLTRRICFPDENLPKPAELDAEQIDILAVFAGDGTIHSVVTGLYGWNGAVLVLPGGTMNMLSKRLHGDIPAVEIARKLTAPGAMRRVRPKLIVSRHDDSLTGILAGPGAIWNEVREALRAANLLQMVSTAREAIAYSTNGPKVVCAGVDGAREGGYAAITVTPHEGGLDVKGYYAETLADYAGQGVALLNRNFRDGPHDDLGIFPEVRLVCPEGEPMGLLIDGEPFDGENEELFRMGTCGVDLLETLHAR